MKKSLHFLVTTITFVMVMSTFFLSQSVLTQTQAQVQNVSTEKISGKILKREGNTLTVQTNDGVKEVTIPDNVSVTRNTSASKIDALQVGEQVNVVSQSDGQVLSVDSSSNILMGLGAGTLATIAIAILALAALAFSTWKKTKEGHIKTSVGGKAAPTF
jgi:hypothetical protein